MKLQKSGNFTGLGSEVVEGHRVVKEQAAQRVRSWTVQNQMRGSLDESTQALHEGFSIMPILKR